MLLIAAKGFARFLIARPLSWEPAFLASAAVLSPVCARLLARLALMARKAQRFECSWYRFKYSAQSCEKCDQGYSGHYGLRIIPRRLKLRFRVRGNGSRTFISSFDRSFLGWRHVTLNISNFLKRALEALCSSAGLNQKFRKDFRGGIIQFSLTISFARNTVRN